MEKPSNNDKIIIKQEPGSSGENNASTSNKNAAIKRTIDYKSFISGGTLTPGMKPNRLPSLKSPRDLTLSGNTKSPAQNRPRIIVTPNISQKRIKSENVM